MTPFPDDDVDPEIRAWLTAMFAASAALGARPGLAPDERRAIAERQRAPWTRGGPEMAASEELTLDSARIRIHRPTTEAPLPVLVYLHGGGWTLFSIDTHDRLMREYAGRAGCAVVGIDYPLAPEHRFPVAIHAIHAIDAVLDWLVAEGAGHGLDPTRLALGGDSAGANLAVATALVRRDRGAAMPCALLLNYGAFDGAWTASYDRYGDGDRYMLTGPEMDAFWAIYLGPDARLDPQAEALARPLRADLADLPPAWLCVAECDVLLDENRAMAARLPQAELRVYPGATHSFLEAVSASRLADRAIGEAAHWLAGRLFA